MNETMQQIMSAAVPVLCLLITAGGAYLVALLRKKTAQLQQELDNKTAEKYIGMAFDAVAQAVTATAQTFVDALKDEDAFTKEKQLEAFNMAKETVLAILGEAAVAALREIYGDFDAWLDTAIEQKCREIKATDNDAMVAIASAACAIATTSGQMLAAGACALIDDEEAETKADHVAAPEESPMASTFMRDSYE